MRGKKREKEQQRILKAFFFAFSALEEKIPKYIFDDSSYFRCFRVKNKIKLIF